MAKRIIILKSILLAILVSIMGITLDVARARALAAAGPDLRAAQTNSTGLERHRLPRKQVQVMDSLKDSLQEMGG